MPWGSLGCPRTAISIATGSESPAPEWAASGGPGNDLRAGGLLWLPEDDPPSAPPGTLVQSQGGLSAPFSLRRASAEETQGGQDAGVSV